MIFTWFCNLRFTRIAKDAVGSRHGRIACPNSCASTRTSNTTINSKSKSLNCNFFLKCTTVITHESGAITAFQFITTSFCIHGVKMQTMNVKIFVFCFRFSRSPLLA